MINSKTKAPWQKGGELLLPSRNCPRVGVQWQPSARGKVLQDKMLRENSSLGKYNPTSLINYTLLNTALPCHCVTPVKCPGRTKQGSSEPPYVCPSTPRHDAASKLQLPVSLLK